jgi:hypothetical protein|tara:strand:+ start:349 stop:633 length:285 start_codon:yes stop_codon:yes gene_type:complete
MANVNFQSIALGVYLFICIFDFVVVPVWFGLNRPEISGFIDTMNTMDNPQLQMELMKKMTDHHNPYTLLGGGLFHLSFGAILTGSVLNRKPKTE